MNDKIMKVRKLLCYSFSIIGICLIMVSLYTMIYDYISIKNSIYISAKVISLDINSDFANIKYTANSKEYENQISNNNYAVNDEVMIRVSIKNPLIQVDNHNFISIPSIIIGILLLLITLKKSILYLKKAQNIHNLKMHGLFIQANITEILVNSNGAKYKGVYPYKLRSKYLNPKDNTLYTFDSEDTYENLNDILNRYGTKWIVVYIDKTNTNNYYVDLNSLIPHRNLIDPIEFMKNKPVVEEDSTIEDNKEDNQESSNSNTENTQEVTK